MRRSAILGWVTRLSPTPPPCLAWPWSPEISDPISRDRYAIRTVLPCGSSVWVIVFATRGATTGLFEIGTQCAGLMEQSIENLYKQGQQIIYYKYSLCVLLTTTTIW